MSGGSKMDINEVFRGGGRSVEWLDEINKASIVMLAETGLVARPLAQKIGDAQRRFTVFYALKHRLDDRFAVRVAEWERLGLVNPWFIDKGHICYRGVHGMKEIPRYLAEGLDIRTSARVARITSGRSVVLETGEEFHADAVLITAPAPQAMTLLEAPPAAIANAFTKIEFDRRS